MDKERGRELKEYSSGFSLLEIMIALILIGLLGSVTLPLLKQHQELQKTQTTRLHQERIFYALAAFIHTQGRLPCPSDPDDQKRFGHERLRCQRPEHMRGLVPFKTLGLSEGMSKNGQQIFFTYVVHPQLTTTRNLQEYCQNDLRHLISLSQDTSLDTRFDPVAVLLISPCKKEETGGFRSALSSTGLIRSPPVTQRWENAQKSLRLLRPSFLSRVTLFFVFG